MSGRRSKLTKSVCAACGWRFECSTFPGGSTEYCSLACGTRWGDGVLIRAARKRSSHRLIGSATYEHVDRSVVGDRDGWKCGLCNQSVDPSLMWPHPLSQSLDHIVPVSRGGDHTYKNTRITHLRCNILRSNGEELAAGWREFMTNSLRVVGG